MVARCPYCEHDEFCPEYVVERTARGWRALVGFLFQRTGKTVRCAKCTRQFAISRERGAYKIAPDRDTAFDEMRAQDERRKAEEERARAAHSDLIDSDQAAAWRQ